MQVKNISSRMHSVGNVDIAPGQTAEIDDDYGDAINKRELVQVLELKADEAPVVEDEAPVVEVKPAKEKNK